MDLAPLATGALFADDYEIVRPLRSGGMGTIYVAEQRSTGKQRALKLMLPQYVADESLRRRFEQEARIASLIESDHVVEVVGAGIDETSGVPWLAMELLVGQDLERAIEVRGPMLLPETWRVMRQICHALSAAHEAGIVHRDLKPENVFLADARSPNESTVVKVLDFGIAKIAAEATASQTAAVGSPKWMAPEQTEMGEVTPAADVWALGLLAFYLFTGKCFWRSCAERGASVQQIMREVLFGAIPPASERARSYGAEPYLPSWFDAWFALCVNRDPKLRFKDATKAFSAFDRACGNNEPPRRTDPPLSLAASAPALERAVPSHASARTMPAAPRSLQKAATEATMLADSNASDVAAPDATATRAGAAQAPWSVRPALLLAFITVIGAAGTLVAISSRFPRSEREPPVEEQRSREAPLPPELEQTDGGRWFVRVKGKCNPVEIDVLMRGTPPPSDRYGVGFSAACLVLAGRVEQAKKSIDALPKGERTWASWPVFEVVHPIADSGDDTAAAPAMRLVLEYWPNNYMALYHAGMSEYGVGDLRLSKDHLSRFLALYDKQDGFTATGKVVLEAINRGRDPGVDCSTPLTIDPEGRAVPRLGCESRR